MGPALLGVQLLLLAQAPQGMISGTVRDAQTCLPIARAAVTLTDLERSVPTDDQGCYAIRQVPAGPHDLTFRFIGYEPRTMRALVPSGESLEISVSLAPEPIPISAIDVPAPLMAPDFPGPAGAGSLFDREVSAESIHRNPLLAEPDALQALTGGGVFLEMESPNGLQVRGGSPDQTAYVIDGIPVFNPFHTAGTVSGWNPDAISSVRLSSTVPLQPYPQALSGTVEAVTRAPGDRLRGRGSVSTTQSRLTIDGPLAPNGPAVLVSLRNGLRPQKNEASYLKGGTGDWLAKLETKAMGGRLQILGYGNENDLSTAAATTGPDGNVEGSRRNGFEWSSQSVGAQWARTFSRTALRVVGWNALGDAGSSWTGNHYPLRMTASRRDQGLLATADVASPHATTTAEIRFERSRSFYRIEPDSAVAPAWSVQSSTPVATARALHSRGIGRRLGLDAGASLAMKGVDLYPAPSARVRWDASDAVSLSAGYARTHQFSQSLRNPESVVGNVFPVDLFVGSGAPGVPVARADQGIVSVTYRLSSRAVLGWSGYDRRSGGLLLVAPSEGEPFSTGNWVTGSSTARGISLDAALTSRRCNVVASYTLQRVRFYHDGAAYASQNGAEHLLSGGVTVLPSATTSIRLGASAATGRRGTRISNAFEWEAANLLDGGCEFGGSPYYDPLTLGQTKLPAYLRVDLGVRKLWRFGIAGRGGTVALFGTVTNLFGRKNVLTYAWDETAAKLEPIEMRPRAPLVVGLDWSY